MTADGWKNVAIGTARYPFTMPTCGVDGGCDGPCEGLCDEAVYLEAESFDDHYGDEIEGDSTVEDYDVERDDRLVDDAQRTLF